LHLLLGCEIETESSHAFETVWEIRVQQKKRENAALATLLTTHIRPTESVEKKK
jgi:hypothetical protein